MPHTTPAPDYQVKLEHLSLGGLNYQIRSLLDRQQFFDPDGVAERAGISSASWPLFGLVWPSARILAGIAQTLPLAGKRVLEIGCGLGLASLVMQRRGADITASDLHPLAAGFMTENLHLNQLDAIDFRTGNWADADNTLGAFDLIVGSDVLYERDLPDALAGFLDRHAKPTVEVIIIDPNRSNRAAFTRRMRAFGFAHSETRAAAHQECGEAYQGRVLNYRRGYLPAP
ncbi:MAG: methyltransferase domain-containing protein [Hydrogenophilales bacterium]|nr:methyltransferase domain-containing protein [Hydrogenophilales bacterium]